MLSILISFIGDQDVDRLNPTSTELFLHPICTGGGGGANLPPYLKLFGKW